MLSGVVDPDQRRTRTAVTPLGLGKMCVMIHLGTSWYSLAWTSVATLKPEGNYWHPWLCFPYSPLEILVNLGPVSSGSELTITLPSYE